MIVCETVVFSITQTRNRVVKGMTIPETRTVTKGLDWVSTSPWMPKSGWRKNEKNSLS